MLIDFFIVS